MELILSEVITKEETMKQAAYNLCYIAACAVNGIMPSEEKIKTINLEKLHKISKMHGLSALCAMTVVSAGVKIPTDWQTEKDKALRKSILFTSEREKILCFMEKNGIWYMPMKGVILANLYPKIGMREMSDNDILYDKKRQADLVEFMRANGYKAKSIGKKHHDTFFKEPVYNFEMHTAMFAESYNERFSEYYADITSRLITDGEKKYARHMSDDDFYIHITAHEYKHYSQSGTGLRSLLDRYVYMQKKQLNFEYITTECAKLGIDEFEAKSRILCEKIFSCYDKPKLTESERKMLECYMFSTTYGTREQKIRHRLEKDYGKITRTSKARYIFNQIFPETEYYKTYYPQAYKCRILIPFVWVIRAIKVVFCRRKQLKRVFGILRNMADKNS